MNNLIKSCIASCSDIGMRAFNRGKGSCVHRTVFCEENCYNNKLYGAFGHTMCPKDVRNDWLWANVAPWHLAEYMKGAKVKRLRLCSRGEPISDMNDVDRIRTWAMAMPGILIWIPTRSWRDKALWAEVKRVLKPMANVRVLASIDPSNTRQELLSLVREGTSTMFFGDDDQHPLEGVLDDDKTVFRCPKTWRKAHGHCGRCNAGCFNLSQRHIWLKKH